MAPGPLALRRWMVEHPAIGIKALADAIGCSPCTASRLRNGTFSTYHADHLLKLESFTGGAVRASSFVTTLR